jgi:hypothetical protein
MCCVEVGCLRPKVDLGQGFRPQPMGIASMATLPTPFAAYSKGPGLAELLRLYVCGLQPRPSVQLHRQGSSPIMNIPVKTGNPEFLNLDSPASARVTSHMYLACIQCRFARSQSFNSLRMARQGAPSDPASFTGGQINSYRPAGTSERSTPSSKTTPRSRNARWTGICSSARATER